MKRVQGGYTILETMIVLAISASMFIMAVIALSGRQQDIQFSQAVRDFEARVNDIANDVSTGYYASTNDVNCTVGSNPSSRPQPDGRVPLGFEQGRNDQCVYIGKVIEFNPPGEPDSTFYVYNLVGRRNAYGGGSVNNLEDAKPVAVAPTDPGDFYQLADQISIVPLDWGLNVTRVATGPAPSQFLGGVAFVTTFSNSVGVGLDETDISNSESVRYGGIDRPTGAIDADVPTEESIISRVNRITDNPVQFNDYVEFNNPAPIIICLQSASEDRRAAVVIGEDGTTSTTTQFDDYNEAVCGT